MVIHGCTCLLLLLLTGGGECALFGPGGQRVTLNFAVQVGGEEVKCGQLFSGMGTTGENCEILDARFYVSNIRLITHEGDQVPMELDQDGTWQVHDVALLDFEDATGGCGDLGNAARNVVVTGSVPDGHYEGVVFDIGVPFELNHADLAAAPSPLNVSAMYWSWAIGHKFLRVDLMTEGGTQWNMHLGSTMCESDGPTDSPVSECARPNRVALSFPSFDHDHDVIVLDIRELFASSDITQDTPDTSSGCQTFPGDVNECTHLFPNLGLDFESGRCIDDCANQTVFRVESGVDRGMEALNRVRHTTGGEMYACADCHGADAMGDIGPDIRSSNAAHVLEHPFGDGPHPVKFDDLTQVQANDIAIFLASLCEADPDCVPGSTEGGHHDEGDAGDGGGSGGEDHDGHGG